MVGEHDILQILNVLHEHKGQPLDGDAELVVAVVVAAVSDIAADAVDDFVHDGYFAHGLVNDEGALG